MTVHLNCVKCVSKLLFENRTEVTDKLYFDQGLQSSEVGTDTVIFQISNECCVSHGIVLFWELLFYHSRGQQTYSLLCFVLLHWSHYKLRAQKPLVNYFLNLPFFKQKMRNAIENIIIGFKMLQFISKVSKYRVLIICMKFLLL